LSQSLRYDAIVKYDTETQSAQVHEYGNHKYGSESPFISIENSSGDDDGYVISFVTDARENTSEVVILDAKNVDQELLARIQLPQRLPLGFHAC